MARRGGTLGRSVLDLDVDDSKFSSGLERNRRKAKSWTDSLGRDTKRGLAQGLGIAAGLGVAGAVSAAIGGVQAVVAGSIDAAMKWESAFAGVRKTVDASEAEFATLSTGIREMATEMPIAATELAGLAEAAGALGVAKKDIMEFTRVTALIGTTTDVSSDQAATSLGQLSNVLGLTSADYERFGSTLVDLGNKGASTESQILEIASRAGAGSKLIGMASDETLAWASSVANLGIEVEAGGSALQKFFLDTAKAVSTGGDKLETYARIAGTTGAEFKRAFEEDASGALQTFLAGLGELTQGEQLQALADLDFNDVRITRTLLGLANGTTMVADSLDVANEAWEANIALQAEADKRFSTSESKMVVLGNRVNDLAITFGETLLPVFVDLATGVVDWLDTTITNIGIFVDAIGDAARFVQIYFGDMGKTVEDWANETGRDVGESKDAVLAYMNETGAALEEAITAVETYGPRNTAALERAAKGWEWYQDQNIGAMLKGTAAVEEGMEGVEGALLAGEGPIGDAADTAFSAIDKEAQEARGLVIDAMSSMLQGISSMFESDESVRDAWQALIDRMDDPYTEAERKADIFGTNTIEGIRGAIASGDPLLIADTKDLVNRLLTEFGLMRPAALELGRGVPPALQEGMDTQMAALIAYIEQEVTHESLEAMTLEEAEQLGLDGIWKYAQGMRSRKQAAIDEAAAVKRAVDAQLALLTGYQYGVNFVSSLAAGISDTEWRAQSAAAGLAQVLRKPMPGSEPEDPNSALAGITDAWGLVDTLSAAILGDLSPLQRAGRGIADALAMPIVSMPHLADIEPFTAGDGAFGGAMGRTSNVTTIYELHVDGKRMVVGDRDDVLDAWAMQSRFSDRSLIS